MKKRLLNILGRDTFNRRKLSIFSVFFILATILWFLIKLSESHVSTLTYDIVYTSVPDDKLILDEPQKTITIEVRATGYDILRLGVFRDEITLHVSKAQEQNGKFFFTPQYLERTIKEQINKSLTFESLLNDTIYLSLGRNMEKKLPVIHQLSLTFEKDFDLYGSLLIIPDSVTVKGPENILDTLGYVTTEPVELTSVKSDFETKASLTLPGNEKAIYLSVSDVLIRGKVERYSEKVFTVPVLVINKPQNISLRLFPEQVKVTCRGSLKDLKLVNQEDILVVCDFNEAGDSGILIPKIQKYPPFLSTVVLQDKKVEFLIQRK
ncbi:YbbR-like domain-containing protein [Ascidiimonas aurantiaca]|uniref:YbbR-like domain-containing protein n=1 Tax=Ascidiimonas aurantiaca TaxID=1685432 RepID=UPI0030EC19A6